MSEDYSMKRAGNYTLVRKLGDGGFATVYLAQHTVLEKKAAVKLLLGEWVDEPDVVSRFFDEARTMESVSEHPNIVKIIDIATKEKCQEEGLPPYFIMEYLEGKSLEDLMKSSDGFSLEEIVRIMDSALSALQFCHDHGVVHRDIKPSNFMMDADGNVKLTDFGIAKAAENTSKPGEGLTLGSTDYMSPEQALGKRDLDYRSDIYSLGVTLYQLVCDRLPFIADSANAVALKHIQEKPIPPIELNGEVPRRLNNVILKAMEKEREHRFQSCNEMKAELDKLLDPNADDVPVESDSGKTGVRTTSLDLSTLHAESGDEGFSRDEYDETTNYTGMTTRKLVSKPPVALVSFVRTVLIIVVASVFFLGIFYVYGKMTNVHLKLESSPSGANIYINKAMVGTSPLELSLAPMQYLVSFKYDGYGEENRLYDGVAGSDLNVSVKLIKTDPEGQTKLKATLDDFKGKVQALSKTANSKSKKDQTAHQKNLEEVSKIYSDITDLFVANDNDIRYGKAYIEASKAFDKLDEAKGKITELINKGDNTADLHCLLCLINKAQGNKDGYKLELDNAYIIDKNNKNVLNAYGDYYAEQGEKERAKQFWSMSLFLYPEQPEIKAKQDKL
ncbi:MAG: serine/threonine protein kinase [Candidatus Riflebacteria bacterium]|nr:serine/threonine protein kinase [Candidatus Riflebacteria bacterium]